MAEHLNRGALVPHILIYQLRASPSKQDGVLQTTSHLAEKYDHATMAKHQRHLNAELADNEAVSSEMGVS